MDAPKRIWAWPHFDGWITGDWSANTYHDERTVAYILVSEHDRLMAERDAFHIEMDRLQTKAMGAVDAARAIEADYVRLMAEKDARITVMRKALLAFEQHEASHFRGPDAEKNRRQSYRGVKRAVRAALKGDSDE